MSSTGLNAALRYRPAEWVEYRGVRLPLHFGDAREEYRAARSAAALFDRADRTVVVLTGRDRKSWLHNLVTNAVATLDEGAGTYAFAVDLRGRVQFDLNVLCLREGLWLDLDAQATPGAIAHLERYFISEDVRMTHEAGRLARLGVAGPASAAIAARLGAGALPAMASLGSIELAEGARLVRHDFAGVLGFELIVPTARAALLWDELAQAGATPAGLTALDALRIEAGIPWLGRDLDDSVVAPETGQIERAISYHKGCYLGQEVIERMRSHGSLARRLTRAAMDDGDGIMPPCPLLSGERDAGRLTSLVRHPTEPRWIGLAYVRTALPPDAPLTAGDPPRPVTIVP